LRRDSWRSNSVSWPIKFFVTPKAVIAQSRLYRLGKKRIRHVSYNDTLPSDLSDPSNHSHDWGILVVLPRQAFLMSANQTVKMTIFEANLWPKSHLCWHSFLGIRYHLKEWLPCTKC
jgi:hypothetical protein